MEIMKMMKKKRMVRMMRIKTQMKNVEIQGKYEHAGNDDDYERMKVNAFAMHIENTRTYQY